MLLRILLLVFLSHCLTGVSYRENKIEKIFSCSINSFSGTDNGVTTQFFSQLVILSVKQHTKYCMKSQVSGRGCIQFVKVFHRISKRNFLQADTPRHITSNTQFQYVLKQLFQINFLFGNCCYLVYCLISGKTYNFYNEEDNSFYDKLKWRHYAVHN